MKEPFVTFFAFFTALNVLTQLTHGRNHLGSVENDIRKRPWGTSETLVLDRDSRERRDEQDYWSNDTQSIDNKTISGLNYSMKVAQPGIKETNRKNSSKSPRAEIPNIDSFDQKGRPRNLLYSNYKNSFRKGIRKRHKIPRQEIDFVDNQGPEAKQDGYEGGPRYQDVAGNVNSENSDSNSYSNSYVTIIDNDDGKVDTDSYSTLSSDAAKSEYTNVESSMNEGAKEESQIVGKEVNDVMGALTKSDSKINQFVGGGRQTSGQSVVFPFKPAETTANDDVVISVVKNKEEDNYTHRRPTASPADVMVIEDKEGGNPSDNTRPILSKNVWDVIQNFTYQDQKEQTLHRGEDSQSGTVDTVTHLPGNFPPPQNGSEISNLRHPSNLLTDLESKLNMFTGSKTKSEDSATKLKPENIQANQAEDKLFLAGDAEEGLEKTFLNSQMNLTHSVDNVTKEKPENNQTNHDEDKVILTGDAEEGLEKMPVNLQMNASSPYLHKPENGNIPQNKLYPYNQDIILRTNSSGENSILLSSPRKAPFRTNKGDSKNVPSRPVLIDSYTEDHSGLNVSDKQVYTTDQNTRKLPRPGDGISYTLKLNRSSESYIGSVGIHNEEGNTKAGNPNIKLVNGNVNLKQLAENIPDKQQAQYNKQYLKPNASSFLSNASSKGLALFTGPTQPKPDDVRIIYVKPMYSGSSGKNQQVNKTILFKSDGKPYRPLWFQSQSQSHQNSGNRTNDLHQDDTRLPWTQANHMSSVEKPLNQHVGLPNDIQPLNNHKEPDIGETKAIASHDRAAFSLDRNYKGVQKGFFGLPQPNEMSSQTVHKGNRSLESWTTEYHRLIEKLKELYEQAYGNSSPDSAGNTESNNVEKMMKKVSTFHTLFLGQNNKQKGKESSEENKGKFLQDPKAEVKERLWKDGRTVNSSGYLSDIPNMKSLNNRDTYNIQKNILTMAHIYKDVPGKVRSMETASYTNEQDPNKNGSSNKKPETLESKANTTFVNHQLASKQPRTDYASLTNSSGTLSLKDNEPSSHQVLMTYFGNETNLRKRLHNTTDTIQMNEFTVSGLPEMNRKEDQPANSTNSAATESTGVKVNLSADGGIAMKSFSNNSVLTWPSQVRNESKEEEEESLSKYIQDFISMISPNKTIESNNVNGISRGSSSSSVPAPKIVAVSSSDASKKGNVTDMNNRVIIVVSPKSLQNLMKNRAHNSSLLAAQKDHPVAVGKGENSTAKSTSNVNKTMVNSEGNVNSLFDKPSIGNQVFKQKTAINRANDTSGKETNASEINDADLNLLYREELKSLEISLSRDFMSNWIYYQKSLDEMKITPNLLRSGIANLGSPQRLKKVFKKALMGNDVNVLVVGGSISAGGGIEKDRGNIEGVYHKAFKDWWNKTVAPITTSQLKINTVAIGGTDSEYFSYCVKNYMRSLPDIVIWELAANDYQRYKGRNFAPAKPLEQLTRIILSLPSQPALIFANFFRGNYYRTAVGQDCPDSEDEGGKTLAQYYKVTSLSWRNVICSSLAAQELDLKKLFSSDGYHPSLLGHAQMSTLLISYLKGVFEETISQEMTLSRNNTLQSPQPDKGLATLPKPIFDVPVTPRPYCWTLLTPDYDKKLRNTLPDLEFTEATGFQFANVSHWPVRPDRLRCLKAIEPGGILKMKFVVPSHDDSDDGNPRMERELAVTTHNAFGGSGAIWVDENQQSAKIIREHGGQRRTQVDVLTRTLAPGAHTVTVSALEPGFCLSAVAVL